MMLEGAFSSGQSGRPWTGGSSRVDWPLHTATAIGNLELTEKGGQPMSVGQGGQPVSVGQGVSTCVSWSGVSTCVSWSGGVNLCQLVRGYQPVSVG